jgi:hypothetical protein
MSALEPPVWHDYDWAVLSALPRVHTSDRVSVAVLVHARRAGFLGFRALLDREELAARLPSVDVELLIRYLEAAEAVCRGEVSPGGGLAAVALAPPSERFHWLTAPRSDVLQPSPVHGGRTRDPEATLEHLFREQVIGNRT